MSQTFSKGDKVSIRGKSTGKRWDTDKIERKYPGGIGYVISASDIEVKVGRSRSSKLGNMFLPSDLELVKSKPSIMQKVSAIGKRLLNKKVRLLVEEGYLDSALNITGKGRGELDAIQFERDVDELAKVAADDRKRRKAKKNGTDIEDEEDNGEDNGEEATE